MSPVIGRAFQEDFMKGKLIVFEGADGTGTTTQSKIFAERLSEVIGEDRVVLTYEPSDDVVGQLIRKMLTKKEKALSPDGMTHLFWANRISHLDTIVKPALNAGKFVVCDRYCPSTVVYQSVHLAEKASDVHQEMRIGSRMIQLKEIAHWGSGVIEPYLMFWLVANPGEVTSRLLARREAEGVVGDELYEGIETRLKIAELYHKYGEMFPHEWEKVHTEVGIEQTSEICWETFLERIGSL
jgi:dTMP kinase